MTFSATHLAVQRSAALPERTATTLPLSLLAWGWKRTRRNLRASGFLGAAAHYLPGFCGRRLYGTACTARLRVPPSRPVIWKLRPGLMTTFNFDLARKVHPFGEFASNIGARLGLATCPALLFRHASNQMRLNPRGATKTEGRS